MEGVPYGWHGTWAVRPPRRMGGIFVGLKFGLWKVSGTLPKLLQNMQFAFSVFHPVLGSFREINSSEILIGSDCFCQ
jgi:hypothetical protein